jgi:hypothetical protein
MTQEVLDEAGVDGAPGRGNSAGSGSGSVLAAPLAQDDRRIASSNKLKFLLAIL